MSSAEPPPSDSGFFRELRRRKVFRTAGAYLAAAFIVLQAADLTFEPLGLPAGMYKALIVLAAVGLPVALVLSWFFEVRGESAKPGRLKPAHAVLIGLVFVALAGASILLMQRGWQRADAAQAGKLLVVLPFPVVGDPDLEYLENGVVEILSRSVDGVGGLRAVPPEIVLSGGNRKSPRDAAARARELGARFVVTGNIASAGGRLRLTASVEDTTRSDAPRLRVVEVSEDSVFQGLDRLAAEVLAATRAGDYPLSQAAALTTRSLPALREYLQGEEYYRRVRFDSAVVHFARATEHDSTFALAHYRIASAYTQSAISHSTWGQLVPARYHVERAVQYADRLAPRDQRMVSAFADLFNGKFEAAETQLRELLGRNSQDNEVRFLLAALVFIGNPLRGQPVAEAQALLESVAVGDVESRCPI